MKCKAIPGLLALIVTLVLSATAAQAGNGGLPSALTSFFACYSITNTKDSGQTVDIESADQVGSPIGVPDRKNVRIGSGSLACTLIRMLVPPSATNPMTQFLAEPNPNHPDDEGFNGIKCYSVTGPGGTLFSGPSGTFNFEDTIWGNLGTLVELPPPPDSPPGTPPTPGPFPGSLDTEKGITISQLKYICGPAKITQP
jgi:hypothetical protein